MCPSNVDTIPNRGHDIHINIILPAVQKTDLGSMPKRNKETCYYIL